jgi:long-chain acyl-CoA synthetase
VDSLHPDLERVVSLENEPKSDAFPILEPLSDWLAGTKAGALVENECDPTELASIIYTSGTTGRSKGVMLSHWNIVKNCAVTIAASDVHFGDVFLSFLPLSHTLERMGGYILPMAKGATVAYSRSIPQLAEDLLAIKPMILVSVPRIFERVYAKVMAGLEEKPPVARKLFELAVDVGWNRFLFQQRRGSWSPKFLLWPLLSKLVGEKVLSKLGGRMRFAVCGGAAMNPDVAQLFIGLGLPILQGYGLTETSPVITCNRLEDNVPASIGTVVSDVEIRVSELDELETRSECVMMGYWKNEEATQAMTTEDGWFRTGDKARIDPVDGHVYITGRLKDIIVLSNGEKVPPSDMEQAMDIDPLVDQSMVIGEAKPYLTAVLVLNPATWPALCDLLCVDPNDVNSLREEVVKGKIVEILYERMSDFPSYAHVKQVTLSLDPWTVEDGLITPTLKVKRPQVMKRFEKEIEEMYSGH